VIKLRPLIQLLGISIETYIINKYFL